MKKKLPFSVYTFLPVFLVAVAIPLTGLPQTGNAQNGPKLLHDSVFDQQLILPDPVITPAVKEEKIGCAIDKVDKVEYKGKLLSVSKDEVVQPGQYFTITVQVQNVGNVPWFSASSGCSLMPSMNLGTNKDRDRQSPFFNAEINPETNGNTWSSPNRITMDSKRVNPQATATFVITAKAPQTPGMYREYFSPVAEGVTWLEGEALFATDINVGGVSLSENAAKYVQYIQHSDNLSAMNFDGEKNIAVSIKLQRMYVKIGDTVIKTFPVSTGAYNHPTPQGKYSILTKQEVRIAGTSPHYIMPLFMMFRKGGYGIHALPSLRNDNGYYWKEAFNHIGIPLSHGCVRLLPDDAQFVWNFVDIGTSMVVRK